jgi:putative ABC transport system permease protein
MWRVSLKMLMGDRAKFLGLIFGICFATLLMSQQVAIFVGILSRTASQIEDITEADIWVMDPQVRYFDEIISLSDYKLYNVRGVSGVEWAVPFYKSYANIRVKGRDNQQVVLLGVDDNTLIGQPPHMKIGKWEDIKKPNALIMDQAGWEYIWGKGEKFEYGREIEMNDKRVQIVGICEASPPFQTFPIVYARYSEAVKLAPQSRNVMSFILAKSKEGVEKAKVIAEIKSQTGLEALTTNDFRWRSIVHYLKKTGIPVNFGITVTLGFIIGAVIAGQTFYIFVIENMKQFGALKAIGLTNFQLLKMVLLQAFFVALLGYGMGIGLAATFFAATANITALKGIYLLPEIMLMSAGAVLVIIIIASLASIRRVMIIDPAIVFRG